MTGGMMIEEEKLNKNKKISKIPTEQGTLDGWFFGNKNKMDIEKDNIK